MVSEMISWRKSRTATLYENVSYYPPRTANSRYLHNPRHNLDKNSNVIHETHRFLQGFKYHLHDFTAELDNDNYCELNGILCLEYVVDGFIGQGMKCLGDILKDEGNIYEDPLNIKGMCRFFCGAFCLGISERLYGGSRRSYRRWPPRWSL